MEVRREDRQGGKRLMSLDALRGFDMFWIVGGAAIFKGLAKGTGSEFMNQHIVSQLNHVPWEGFSFMDLIMPLFLFIVGVAMPFSFGKRLGRDDRKWKLLLHVLWRAVILFLLGMIAQGRLLTYDPARIRIYCNTLQAIAVGYLIASIIVVNFRLLWQIAAMLVLLVSFWALMMLVPVPGHDAGILTGEVNPAIYLDKLILGRFEDKTSYTWILSGITFGASVLLGAFAGQLLRSGASPRLKTISLLLGGAGCMIVGYAWGFWFPIVKHIWTSSFVLYSGGMCLILLALFYLVIDVWGFRLWAYGFVVIGMNAIAVYMVTRLFDFRILGDIFVKGLAKWTGDWHSFVRSLAGFLVMWLILWWMYRKKSFVRI